MRHELGLMIYYMEEMCKSRIRVDVKTGRIKKRKSESRDGEGTSGETLRSRSDVRVEPKHICTASNIHLTERPSSTSSAAYPSRQASMRRPTLNPDRSILFAHCKQVRYIRHGLYQT